MRLIFIEFFIYSVLGYLLEIVYASILNKRLYLNRGFLTGPYCPIYGFALLFIKSLTMGKMCIRDRKKEYRILQ